MNTSACEAINAHLEVLNIPLPVRAMLVVELTPGLRWLPACGTGTAELTRSGLLIVDVTLPPRELQAAVARCVASHVLREAGLVADLAVVERAARELLLPLESPAFCADLEDASERGGPAYIYRHHSVPWDWAVEVWSEYAARSSVLKPLRLAVPVLELSACSSGQRH